MSATTYERTTYERTGAARHTGLTPTKTATAIGNGILHWLASVGERSAAGRSAAHYQRLNAMSDAELESVGLRREELVSRCFGWRGLY